MPSNRTLAVPSSATRRRALRALAGVAGASVATSTAGCVQKPVPPVVRPNLTWPGFLGGPRRTGWHAAASGPEPPVEDSWTWTNAALRAAAVRPAVADDIAYVAFVTGSASQSELVASARSLADGSERWWTSVPVPEDDHFPPATTAVTDEVVVASTPSRLVVLDRDTGEERWRTESAAASPPVIGEAVVTKTAPDQGEGDLRSLDLESGDVRWRTPTSTVESGLGGYLSADPQNVYVRDGASVAAVSLESGALRWSRRLDADGYGSQLDVAPVRDGTLEIARLGVGNEDAPNRGVRLVTVDAESGKVVRETAVTDPTHPWASSAAVGPDTVVLVGGRSEEAARADPSTPRGVVVAVERRTGSVRWRTRGDAFLGGRLRKGPLVDGDTAYVVGDDTLSALSLDDGTVQWQAAVHSRAIFGLAGGGAFVWTQDDTDPGIRYVG